MDERFACVCHCLSEAREAGEQLEDQDIASTACRLYCLFVACEVRRMKNGTLSGCVYEPSYSAWLDEYACNANGLFEACKRTNKGGQSFDALSSKAGAYGMLWQGDSSRRMVAS
ncbi:hypothetical protein L7F22_058653 [Adiantum nelumboides]|nr:hypothetical protein [Adiantum nelumboides]